MEVGGLPAPEVTWWINDQVVRAGQERQIGQHGSVHSLVIPCVKVSYANTNVYVSIAWVPSFLAE